MLSSPSVAAFALVVAGALTGCRISGMRRPPRRRVVLPVSKDRGAAVDRFFRVRRQGAGELSGTVQSSGQKQLHSECHLRHGFGQSCAGGHGAPSRREQILRQFLQQ